MVFLCANGYFVLCMLLLLARFQHVVLYTEPSIEQPFLFLLVSYQDCLFLSIQLVLSISLLTSKQVELRRRTDHVMRDTTCLLAHNKHHSEQQMFTQNNMDFRNYVMEQFFIFQEILSKQAEFMNSTTKLCCGHKFSLH